MRAVVKKPPSNEPIGQLGELAIFDCSFDFGNGTHSTTKNPSTIAASRKTPGIHLETGARYKSLCGKGDNTRD